MKKSVKVTFAYPEAGQRSPKKRMEIISQGEDSEDEDSGSSEIRIYDRSVQLEEVIPLIIKTNRCKKVVPTL